MIMRNNSKASEMPESSSCVNQRSRAEKTYAARVAAEAMAKAAASVTGGLLLTSQSVFAQSKIDPNYTGLSPGDLSTIDQWEFWLGAIVIGGCLVASYSLITSKRRSLAGTIIQLRGWMERQGAVLTNSISPHTHFSTLNFWKGEKHRVVSALKERSLPRMESDRLHEELALIEEKLAVLETLDPNSWWQPFDLPAPVTFRPFQIYMTPWGHSRRRVEAMTVGELKETIHFADKSSMQLDKRAYLEAVEACRQAGWTREYLTEMQGEFPEKIRRAVQMTGSPKKWLDTIFLAGIACVADMRAPDGRPGEPFQSRAVRRDAMFERAKTLASYLKEEMWNQGPFDMPWTRVYASLGHVLAFFEQVENQPADLSVASMRYSTAQQVKRAREIAKQIRRISRKKEGAAQVAALASQLAWMLGAFDSLIWYRGTDNWKQIAQPVMQEQVSIVKADEPSFQRWQQMQPLVFNEPEGRFGVGLEPYEREHMGPGGVGWSKMYRKEDVLAAMTSYSDVSAGNLAVAQRGALPGEDTWKGRIAGPQTRYW